MHIPIDQKSKSLYEVILLESNEKNSFQTTTSKYSLYDMKATILKLKTIQIWLTFRKPQS